MADRGGPYCRCPSLGTTRNLGPHFVLRVLNVVLHLAPHVLHIGLHRVLRVQPVLV